LDAVTKKDPFEENRPREISLKKIILIVYTVLRVLFIICVTVSAFTFIYVSILKTVTLIKYIPYLSFNLQTAVELLKRIFTIVIISLFTRKYRKLFSSIIVKKVKWYRA
jgi:putative peptide zinc metalloprotease protein